MNFLLLSLLAADPHVVEVFKDKGDLFIRAGSSRGLRVGSEVIILGERIGDTDEYRTGGKASVLEVWETLARISPDEDARKLKELKLARLPATALPAAVAAKSAPEPAAANPEPGAHALKGRATINGIGPAKRITLYNDSSTGWTHCELRLPDNRRYQLSYLRAGDHEGIALPRFSQDGTEYDRPLDWLQVRCVEGQTRLNFSM